MLRPISPLLLGYNFKVAGSTVDFSIPEIQVDFVNGKADVQIQADVIATPLSVVSGEVLSVNNAVLNVNIALAGDIIAFGTNISGSGSITGSGRII